MIRIHVKEVDIKNGVRWENDECAVALAVRRRFPKSVVKVNAYSIKIGKKNYRASHCDLKLKNFIYQFDAGKRDELKPFSFSLYEVKS